ncbi:hypothetical protein ACYSNM_00815 [Myroides sp. LJL116]
MNKLIVLVFLSFFIIGCDFNVSQEIERDKLLHSELTKVDWNKVDTYPSTPSCDTISDVDRKKECFYAFMTAELQSRLSQDTLKGSFQALDTLHVLVKISWDNNVSFQLLPLVDSLKMQNVALDSLVKIKTRDFPLVYPATKQGITVNSEFILPIVLVKQ